MRHKILVLLPFKKEEKEFFDYNYEYVFPCGVEIRTLPFGRRMNESPVDSAVTIYEELKAIKQAEKDGFEAVVVGCFLDPGVREARELVDIPVIGTANTALHVCAMLGHRTGVITTSVYVQRGIEANLREHGMEDQVKVRYIDTDAESAINGKDSLVDVVINLVEKMIVEDDCAVFTLGCGGLYGMLPEVKKKLKERGYEVPFVESHRVACEVADLMIELGYRQSRLTYPHLGDYEGLE